MSNRRRKDARRISELYAAAGGGVTSPPARELVSLQLQQDPRSYGNANNNLLKGPSSAKPSRKTHHAAALATAKSGHGVITVGPSSTSSDSAVLSQGDFDRYEMFYEKRRSAIAVITGIFTCWSKSKDGQVADFSGQNRQIAAPAQPRRHLNTLTTAALFEQAKAQQEALLETQDTSDMWEWHMEQQQAIATQEHEMLERTSNAASSDQIASMAVSNLTSLVPAGSRSAMNTPPIIRHKKPPEEESRPHDEDVEDDDQTGPDWGSPGWGWRQQEEIAAEKVMHMFETALLRFRWEVNTFCRVYMQQIVRAGYSLINTLMEMEANTVFLKRVHASYALEARINAALFRCFENDSYDDSGLTHIFDPNARATSRLQEFVRMKGLDPAEALRMHSPSYEPAFHNFAAAKSEEVLALLPAAALAFRSAAQRDRFMDAFLRAAKWSWLLHRLATSMTPQATILRVGRGHPVDALYVEAVAVPPIGSCARCPVTAVPTVEFMIMPGFIAQRKVFRSRIYQHFMCKQL